MSTTEDQVAGAAADDSRPDIDDGGGTTQTVTRQLPLAAYVPMGLTSDYKAPRATVDPDKTKTWLKRAWPIVKAHKGAFATMLITSFIGLVIQVQIPKLLQNAIDNSLLASQEHHQSVPLHVYVTWVVVLGLVGGVVGYISRTTLFQRGVLHRVRPAQHHLRAPDPHVVPLLRPRAVGSAHQPGQL